MFGQETGISVVTVENGFIVIYRRPPPATPPGMHVQGVGMIAIPTMAESHGPPTCKVAADIPAVLAILAELLPLMQARNRAEAAAHPEPEEEEGAAPGSVLSMVPRDPSVVVPLPDIPEIEEEPMFRTDLPIRDDRT